MDEVYVIFHNPHWPVVSPVVCLPRVADIRALLAEVLPPIFDTTNVSGIACAAFIASVVGRAEFGNRSVEVSNFGLLRDCSPEDDPQDVELFRGYERRMAELRSWRHPPVLICMDSPWHATCGQDVLWQWMPHE